MSIKNSISFTNNIQFINENPKFANPQDVLFGLDDYSKCLQENLTNDISLSLIGDFNVFEQTKFIIVHGPSGCGKKKFTELYCQKNFINLIIFYGYSMKKGKHHFTTQ